MPPPQLYPGTLGSSQPELGLGLLCESLRPGHCRPWLPRSDLDLPGPSAASLCLTHAITEVSEARRPCPCHLPQQRRSFFPFYSSAASACAPHDRGWGRLLWERIAFPTDPARPQPWTPSSPTPSIRCGAAREGRRGAPTGDQNHGLTCSASTSRRPAAAGGGLPLRARQCGVPGLAPRRGGGAEGGPAEVGLAEGGNGGDAITKPVRLGAGRTAPPWTEEALHPERRGRRPGEPPRAAAPAGPSAECGPLDEGRTSRLGPPESHVPFARRGKTKRSP